MPDDVSDLMPEFERNLRRANGEPEPEEEPERQPLPKASVNIPIITTLWIKWLPLSIFFFGLAFVAWTLIMIVQVGRYHDKLTDVKRDVKALEEKIGDKCRCAEAPPGKTR